MTEKRYYLENFKDFTVITLRLYDRKIKYKHYDWLTESHKIVDLLNELDEKYVDEFSLRETLQQELQRVEKENEQLKKQREELFIRERDTKNEWRTLKKENEQLKKEIKAKDEIIELYYKKVEMND